MNIPQDRILHIDAELENGKVNVCMEWKGELVPCKDCKHRETDECPMYWMEWLIIDEGDGHTDNDFIIHDYTTDDGYCNFGEREGGDEE